MSEEQIEKNRKRVNLFKSNILSIATNVEFLIELILATHFTKTDEEYFGFAKTFFNDDLELSFYKKIKLLERFLVNFHPDIRKEYPDIINQLNRVRKLRNHFAHSTNPNKEELAKVSTKQLIVVHYIEEGAPKTLEIPIDDLEKRVDDCESIRITLDKIFKTIITKKSQDSQSQSN